MLKRKILKLKIEYFVSLEVNRKIIMTNIYSSSTSLNSILFKYNRQILNKKFVSKVQLRLILILGYSVYAVICFKELTQLGRF